MADSAVPAGPLSHEEVTFIQKTIIYNVVESIGIGILLLLAIMAMHTLVRKGLHASIGRRVLVVAIIVIVLSSMVVFVSGLLSNLKYITFFGPSPVAQSVMTSLDMVPAICCRLNYFISDLIVVWRAWVLSEHSVFHRVLAFCVVTTFGCLIAECFFTIHTAIDVVKNPLLDLLLFVPLITTNACATFIIAHKTWIYYTEIKVLLGGQRGIGRILMLLIESGAIYCTIWVITLISAFTKGSVTFQSVMGAIMPYISGIYPLAIILLVHHGENKDTYTRGNGPGISQPIHFASAPRPPLQSTHSTSIIQSIADHIQSTCHDEESGAMNSSGDGSEGQLTRIKEESVVDIDTGDTHYKADSHQIKA